MANILNILLNNRKLSDETFFEIVAAEIEQGQIFKGLWAMALANTDYDEVRAKAEYLKLRVLKLKSIVPQLLKKFEEIIKCEHELLETKNSIAKLQNQYKALSIRISDPTQRTPFDNITEIFLPIGYLQNNLKARLEESHQEIMRLKQIESTIYSEYERLKSDLESMFLAT